MARAGSEVGEGLCGAPEPVRGPTVMCDPVNIRWCVNVLPPAADLNEDEE